MKTEYGYISFVKIASTNKTSVWDCRNKKNGHHLGVIRWYSACRQYCFFPVSGVGVVLSAGGMLDVVNFMHDLNLLQKLQREEIDGY